MAAFLFLATTNLAFQNKQIKSQKFKYNQAMWATISKSKQITYVTASGNLETWKKNDFILTDKSRYYISVVE